MSIAEKLQLVAENNQRVYDAGYAKGKSEGGILNNTNDAALGADGYAAGIRCGRDVCFADGKESDGSGFKYQN